MIFDTLENSELYSSQNKSLTKAFNYLTNIDTASLQEGKHEIDGEDIYAIIGKYETSESYSANLEGHKKYIDVHYIVQGSERIGVAIKNKHTVTRPYDTKDDYLLFEGVRYFIALHKGEFAILYPNDIHLPGLVNEKKEEVLKVVVKIRV